MTDFALALPLAFSAYTFASTQAHAHSTALHSTSFANLPSRSSFIQCCASLLHLSLPSLLSWSQLGCPPIKSQRFPCQRAISTTSARAYYLAPLDTRCTDTAISTPENPLGQVNYEYHLSCVNACYALKPHRHHVMSVKQGQTKSEVQVGCGCCIRNPATDACYSASNPYSPTDPTGPFVYYTTDAISREFCSLSVEQE